MESVIAKIRSGDTDAWSQLIDEHRPYLYRFVVRMLGHDRPEVDDVVQEAFVALLVALPRFDDPTGDPQVWVRQTLRAICRNKIFNVLKSRRYRRATEVDNDLALGDMPGRRHTMAPDELLEDAEQREFLDEFTNSQINGYRAAGETKRAEVLALTIKYGDRNVCQSPGVPDQTVAKWRYRFVQQGRRAAVKARMV